LLFATLVIANNIKKVIILFFKLNNNFLKYKHLINTNKLIILYATLPDKTCPYVKQTIKNYIKPPMKRIFLFLSVFFRISFSIILCQPVTQTIRGRVTDKITQQPLIGANVIVIGTSPIVGSVTDSDGWFKIDKIQPGRVSLDISYIGYQHIILSNLYLTSGKELIIQAELEEEVQHVGEVVVKASHNKAKTINDMAVISARSFTVEETEKYAGSRGDIARMASNYAGVSFANDARNDIVIRGNSPAGLLWRLEDIDVPNPNHFAENGTTGGPVGMLNNNVLRNSDFFTGAFPAEYGNALSGVFDLKMRNGNNEKYEHMFQLGFNGLELGSEGPFNKKHRSSYLFNYRFSTMDFFDKIGVNFGTAGIPHYQDLSYKLNFPVNKGLISFFGLGGISSIAMLDSKIKDVNLYANEGQDLYNHSKLGATGISYLRNISSKTYAKLIISGLYQDGGTDIDTLDENRNLTRVFEHDISEYRLTITAITGTKYSAGFSSKAGVTVDQMGYDMKTYNFDYDSARLIKCLNAEKPLGSGGYLLRAFGEIKYKINNKLIIVPGMHVLYYTQTGKPSFEPRLGISWLYSKNCRINFGYGAHAKIHALSTYYLGSYLPDGQYIETNKHLGYTKSQQWVSGHDWNINETMRLKSEIYYQYMYNVPVEKRPTYFSLLNSGAGWGVEAQDSLVNEGTGYNYGVELTFEKFLNAGFYYLATASIFESKYKGSDGIERNTAFNGNFVINALAGKEFILRKNSVLSIDLKICYAGGKRYIPVDYQRSLESKYTEYDFNHAYDKQYPDFFKADIKFGFRRNGKRVTEEYIFFIENFTNHKNILLESYSRKENKIITTYQLGFFPMMQYRINF
jgi:hypothetical protein